MKNWENWKGEKVKGGRWVLAVLAAFAVGVALMGGIGWWCWPDKGGDVRTLVKWEKEYVPLPAETIHVPVPGAVDTVYVLKEYFTKKVYRDTIANNDTLQVIVRDTVWQNGISDRVVSYVFNPEAVVKKHSVGVGGIAGAHSFGVMGVYRHGRLAIGGGWDFQERGGRIGVVYNIFEW